MNENLRTFNTEDDHLVLNIPGDLPDNLRRIRSVLHDIGVCNSEIFLRVLNETVEIDPIHLCRMIKHGLLDQIDYFGDEIRLIKLEVHIPVYQDENHIGECSVNLINNQVSFGYFVEEEMGENAESLQPYKQIKASTILNRIEELNEDGKEALREIFKKEAEEMVSENAFG